MEVPREVVAVQHPEELQEDVDEVDLLHPPYWFVHALPWPGGQLGEGAIAYAPIMIPRDRLSRDAQQILGCADLIAERGHQRVVFFSDVTRLLTRGGTSWSQLGIDWQHGLGELADGHYPALYLTITERAYALICGPATNLLSVSADGSINAVVGDERPLVRSSLAQRLETDWPSFMQDVADATA
jgi:hypothetical protein